MDVNSIPYLFFYFLWERFFLLCLKGLTHRVLPNLRSYFLPPSHFPFRYSGHPQRMEGMRRRRICIRQLFCYFLLFHRATWYIAIYHCPREPLFPSPHFSCHFLYLGSLSLSTFYFLFYFFFPSASCPSASCFLLPAFRFVFFLIAMTQPPNCMYPMKRTHPPEKKETGIIKIFRKFRYEYPYAHYLSICFCFVSR